LIDRYTVEQTKLSSESKQYIKYACIQTTYRLIEITLKVHQFDRKKTLLIGLCHWPRGASPGRPQELEAYALDNYEKKQRFNAKSAPRTKIGENKTLVSLREKDEGVSRLWQKNNYSCCYPCAEKCTSGSNVLRKRQRSWLTNLFRKFEDYV